MAKIELETLGSLENQTTAIQVLNDNFEKIVEAFENTFSRDGTTPNYLEAPLDVNSQRVMNLPAPVNGSDAARLVDVAEALVLDGFVSIPSLVGNQNKILGTDGSVLVFRSPVDYPGLGDLKSTLNLSDLANPNVARDNLGLGSASIEDVGTSGARIPLMSGTNIWSGLQAYTGGTIFGGTADYVLNNSPATLSDRSIGFRGAPLVVRDSAYTFVLNDSGGTTLHTSGTAHAYTLPTNAAVAYPLGTALLIVNAGTGNVTITRSSGVTLRNIGSATDRNLVLAQHQAVTLLKYGTNDWYAFGITT